MPREVRAKQFMPFDALKGLNEALRLKEYQYDREQKGDLGDEQILKISNNLKEITKDTLVSLDYFIDGYKKNYIGKIKVDIIEKTISFNSKKIDFMDILDLTLVK